jgi:hypothetical protein
MFQHPKKENSSGFPSTLTYFFYVNVLYIFLAYAAVVLVCPQYMPYSVFLYNNQAQKTLHIQICVGGRGYTVVYATTLLVTHQVTQYQTTKPSSFHYRIDLKMQRGQHTMQMITKLCE